MNLADTVKAISGQGHIREGDYMVDGLWYCGRCNTPKQTKISIQGRIITPMCLCECEAERLKEREEQEKRQEHLEAVKRLRQVGFPDAEMRKMTFDADDGRNRVTQIAMKYVDCFADMMLKGKGILFYGGVGTGKTFASACIANALIDQGHPCLVTNFARLTNILSGMYEGKQKYMDDINRYDLVVIDDLASERDTEYMGEMVQSIIDSRYRSGKPLIVTTNLTSEELKHPQDIRKQRIYSRLFEMCIPVEVKGADRRREALKSDYRGFREVLGL